MPAKTSITPLELASAVLDAEIFITRARPLPDAILLALKINNIDSAWMPVIKLLSESEVTKRWAKQHKKG